jgi:asparagine synthase (glutamine-hydrolysing)
MCGIAGYLRSDPLPPGRGCEALREMNRLQRHRGPDGEGAWTDPTGRVGLSHTRLAIIDLETGAQPMVSGAGNVITFNGEIYNYRELRAEIGDEGFRTTSDTEVILRAYEKWGAGCVPRLRGMFAFAIWDAAAGKLFVARDRFGIKPFHYARSAGSFWFASEIKALLPFIGEPGTDVPALHEYLSFQFCLGDKTLFRDVRQLPPAHCGYVGEGLELTPTRYWEVRYDIDWDHTEHYFVERVRERLLDSVAVHMRSDVEVGAYVSGGTDSSLVAALARDLGKGGDFRAFTGKFPIGDAFDESKYARILAREKDMRLHELEIGEEDFVASIAKVIRHLDHPVAGPGSFPQFMVSGLARQHVKVVLGGQGGDEIFGGYVRYLLAYFEQCIKGAVDGTIDSGNFIVTYESIIPNLRALRNYRPLIQEFWSEGIFEDRDRRYFRLINRANTMGGTVDWSVFGGGSPFDDFSRIYWSRNVGKESYFDSMTHFDFKTLLPALLHVEDRMSMAHGIESRVPFLDHGLVELLATIPSSIKFRDGQLKRLLGISFPGEIPREIRERKDKMGFPVPLQLWMRQGGKAREMVLDLLGSRRAKERFYLAPGFDVERLMSAEGMFSRNLWAFLSLELWQREFHDHHQPFGECA